MAAHATVGRWLVVGGSAVGQLHLKRGLPRDDAFVIRSSGPWLAAAVSDGVGSRPFSRFGSTYVAEALTSLLLRPVSAPLKREQTLGERPDHREQEGWSPSAWPEDAELDSAIPTGLLAAEIERLKRWGRNTPMAIAPDHPPDDPIEKGASVGWWARDPGNDLDHPNGSMESSRRSGHDGSERRPSADQADLVPVVQQAFVKTHLGLREHAINIGLDLADLGCTALGLLLNVETGHCVAGQVGDGAVLGLTEKGRVRELVEAPEAGDLQSVYTINRPGFQDSLAIAKVEPPAVDAFAAFFVMSDGVAGDLLYSAKGEEVDGWGRAVEHNLHTSAHPEQAAAEVLNWLATYQVTGSWDDRTLVVITQRKGRDGGRQSAAERSRSAE